MEQNINTQVKIMLIDDNELDIFIAEKILEKAAFEGKIIVMESSKAALNYLKENAGSNDKIPDVIFLDILMPEMDGYGFLNEFENLNEEVKNKINIIILTSTSNPKDKERAAKYAFVKNFITKPLKISDVLNLN